jgi:hypothetical protein
MTSNGMLNKVSSNSLKIIIDVLKTAFHPFYRGMVIWVSG